MLKTILVKTAQGARWATSLAAKGIDKILKSTKGIVLIIEISSLIATVWHLSHATIVIHLGA